MSIPSSRRLQRILVDSAAYDALAAQDAVDHARWIAVIMQLAREHRPLATTRMGCHRNSCPHPQRLGRDMATAVLQGIDRHTPIVIRVNGADEQRAREIVTTHDDTNYSLTDAIGFAVMEGFGIATAFTIDRHFAQHEFTVLGLEGP